MPRNSSGTYSLYTPGNPVVTSTVISSTWANNTLADLASAITDSLSRSGDGGMQAPLELVNGAVGAPALTFASETTSGLYRVGAGEYRFSALAADVLGISSAGAQVTNGTVAAPAFSFLSDTDSGVYRIGANNIGVGVNGAKVLDVATTGLSVTGTLSVSTEVLAGNGAVGGPAYTFTSDSDTGMYRAGAGAVGFSANGTLVFYYDTASIIARQEIQGPDGTAGAPAFSFESDTNTGIFLNSADQLSISAGGTERFRVGSTFVYSAVQFWAADGTVTAPGLSFANDVDTGFYRTGSGDFSASANNERVFRFLAASVGGAQVADPAGTLQTVGYRQIPRSTTATTFVAADVGKCVAVSAAIDIPASVFSAGDAISVYNDSGSAVNITISAGTLRLAGSASTGTRSLAARGVCTLWFNVGGATPEVIASGSVS